MRYQSQPREGTPENPTPVTVDSTDTVLAGPFNLASLQSTLMGISLTNLDGAQTLTAWVENSPDGITGWEAKRSWAGLEDIGPGETRNEGFTCVYERWLRIVGTASGAGLSATIYVEDFS